MKFLSLFSGVGGFDCGLELSGMKCVGQVEIDKFCNKILDRRFPNVKRWPDVREFSPKGLEFDLLCGGFPCQDLSMAGARKGLEGSRSGLWYEFERIIKESKPSWVLIENVTGLLSSNQGKDFGSILEALENIGYKSIGWRILDTQHFGIPQRRRRLFIVASLREGLTEKVLGLGESCSENTILSGSKEKRNTFSYKRSAGKHDRNITVAPTITSTDHKGVRSYFNNEISGAIVVKTAHSGSNGNGVQKELSYVVDTSSPHNQVIAPAMKNIIRRLTPIECERLQGFPDGWTCLCGEDICKCKNLQRYRLLGNAVSVPVIYVLGKRIMEVNKWAQSKI